MLAFCLHCGEGVHIVPTPHPLALPAREGHEGFFRFSFVAFVVESFLPKVGLSELGISE
jgi:hypothetical protein